MYVSSAIKRQSSVVCRMLHMPSSPEAILPRYRGVRITPHNKASQKTGQLETSSNPRSASSGSIWIAIPHRKQLRQNEKQTRNKLRQNKKQAVEKPR